MKHTSTRYKIFRVFNVLFMLVIIVITLFPYLHVLAKSLNEGIDASRGGITIFPRVFTWDNYKTVLGDRNIFNAATITIARVVIGTLLSLIVQYCAAYVMAKKDFIGKTVLLLFLIIPNFINAGLIPTFMLYHRLGLINNFLVYILPGLFSFYNMIIIRTYIKSTIPDSLEESAKMDGANEITVLLRIFLPLSKPILATVSLWVAVGLWNDWITTLYYVTRNRLFTLQYMLMRVIRESEAVLNMIAEAVKEGRDMNDLQQQIKTTPESLISAQIIITSVPIILVYPFFQKYFVKGVMIGAIKG
ncbi:carbohydrate ABC transporter permease [Pseudoclostridium thermosuccinogenes]|uniref:carbohydrate ABC transporter permease n=1 Tax=Clostridium thermosuccinogenes TaxID=84032 RepID=UPI000CCC77D8|nr:carbohydrate ABC transporter permease [Pseudoclostridium thermosuccinogenes]PNT94269.1 hypothetical protein CDQ83_12560 [Pseudoclostridium thermosuccinogenes]